jgi:hypothetical protein
MFGLCTAGARNIYRIGVEVSQLVIIVNLSTSGRKKL